MLTDPRTRPTPLTILALVCLVAAALLLLSGMSLILVGGLLGMNGIQVGSRNDPLVAFLFGVATLALAGAYLTLYHGFWEQRAWAFNAGFVVAGAGIITVLAGLLFGYGDPGWALTIVVVGVAVMGVLVLPSTQEALGRAVSEDGRRDPDRGVGAAAVAGEGSRRGPEPDVRADLVAGEVRRDGPADESATADATEPPTPAS